MISVQYDPRANSAYVKFGTGHPKVHRTMRVHDDLLVDFDAAGNPIGVERLRVEPRT